MDGGFRDDIGIQTVAEINGIDIVTVQSDEVSVSLSNNRCSFFSSVFVRGNATILSDP